MHYILLDFFFFINVYIPRANAHFIQDIILNIFQQEVSQILSRAMMYGSFVRMKIFRRIYNINISNFLD